MNEQRKLVERALAYPYAVPSNSFLLVDGSPREAPGLDSTEFHATGRTPLLAYGSNAAPEVLAGKLGETARDAPVLAMRATLADFDVVYSAHISRYGSVPAALQPSPGTGVTVFVLYLSEDQLRLIAETEPNYERVTLRGVSCELESGETLGEVATYLSRHGCLLAGDSEIALTGVEARGRRFPAMSQPQVLELVRAALAPEQSLERFVVGSATDPELARRRTEALRRREGAGQTPANRLSAKRVSRP